MTAPSYTEDLEDIATGDEASGWVELTGTDGAGNTYNTMGSPAYQDNEYPYIQGSYAVTQDCTKNTNTGSLAYSSGGITVPTDGAVLVWQNFSSAFVFGTYAQGGYRICIGSGLNDFDVWFVGGNDKGRMPYGGFENHAVNPTITADDTAGTPTATLDYVGSAVYVITGPSKGETHQCDVMRYGRCSAIFEYGELTLGYATIDGFATQNDNQNNRWGLIQEQPGGFLWKGRMQLGTSTNAVDFRDSDRNIFIDWTPKVTANFNLIEVINASSNVEMTRFNFSVLDTTTASSGRFLMTNDANVAIDECTFTDMDTFVFSKSTNTVTIDGSTFRRCGIITQDGAAFDSCLITGHSGTHAMLATNPAAITNSNFVSSGSGHGVRCDTTGTYTWSNTDSGYTGTRGSNLVSSTGSADAMFYNNSGGLITLNISGSGQQPSVRNGAGATTQVNADVNVTFSNMKDNTEVRIYKTSDDSVVDGIENATAGTTDERTFTWTAGAGTNVYYILHNWNGVEPFYHTIRVEGYIVPSSDTTIVVQQQVDRNAA